MFKLLFAVHVLLVVFAIGPLVAAATTASRGLRKADAGALAGSSRVLRIYSLASVVVVVAGFALASTTSDYTHKRTASFGETWVWLSVLLWVVVTALVLAVLVPTLDKAVQALADNASVRALTGRVAALGGVVGLVYAVIIVLMVYRPGS